jgi:hypothetical protein
VRTRTACVAIVYGLFSAVLCAQVAVWTQGHHTRGEGFLDDREKVFAAQLEGWIVGEVSTQQVKSGLLAQRVADAIAY